MSLIPYIFFKLAGKFFDFLKYNNSLSSQELFNKLDKYLYIIIHKHSMNFVDNEYDQGPDFRAFANH